MYSVFIVDDEPVVREGLRTKIDWDHTPFTFAGEAEDGEIALSVIQDIKPDILITDIKMPFMDGLELAQTVKKLQPGMRIIILSGHDEFDYARKAISIGVEEYLLKPFTLEEMISALTRTASELDREKQNFTDIKRMKTELESSAVLVRDKFLSDMVQGIADYGNVIQKAADLHINLIAHYYILCISRITCTDGIDNSPISDDQKIAYLIAAKARITTLVSKESDIIGFFLTSDTFVSILKQSVQEQCEDAAFNFADTVQHELTKNTSCTVITAIGSIVDHTALITKSFHDAENILSSCNMQGKNRIVSNYDIEKEKDSCIVLKENDPLVDRLYYADEHEIDQIIKEYISLIGENSDHFSIIASYLVVDVIIAVSKVIETTGGNIRNVMPEILTHAFVDRTVQNEQTFIHEITNILRTTLKYRNDHSQSKYSAVILKAKKYIEEHYADPDICLHTAADIVHLSPNHFSTVFSQECGTTFIEYLTGIRIRQAQKLLKTSDMKSADIAYETGFSDPHYFSFIFKKVTGSTPRECRSSQTDILPKD